MQNYNPIFYVNIFIETIKKKILIHSKAESELYSLPCSHSGVAGRKNMVTGWTEEEGGDRCE